MSKEKMDRANLLDPNRFKIAHGMRMPDGKENNSPYPVEQASAAPVKTTSIYGDYAQDYQQMGTAMVNPDRVMPSMQPALVQQPQPSANAGDPLEGQRLASEAQNRGLMAHPFMGMDGAKAMMPGAMPPDLPGNVPFLMPTSSVDGMTPGSSMQKTNKKGKRVA